MVMCPGCQTEKQPSEFYANRKRASGLTVLCRPCHRAKQNEYRAKMGLPPQQMTERFNQPGQLERMAYVKQVICSGSCVDCGETDPVVLEFDHVRGEKIFNVGGASRQRMIGITMEQLVAEIAKCEIRCANCHRRATARRGQQERLSWSHQEDLAVTA